MDTRSNAPKCFVARSPQHSTPGISEPNPEHVQQRTSGLEPESHAAPSSLVSETHAGDTEEVVITRIQATDLALHLGRIPAGFFITVHHSGLEWRTENKPVPVNNDVIEWAELIPIPSDRFAGISLMVRASFELQPVLGNGEELRVVKVTGEQLIDHSTKNLAFTFPEGGPSPCSSLRVTVGPRHSDSLESAVTPRCVTEFQSRLDGMTDQGHDALLRYRKRGQDRDLSLAIERFQDVLDICPLDHSCYAISQSNLATARFIHCQVHDTDTLLDVPLMLHRNTLAARPVGHPDRARTLIQLAAVLLVRFEKQRNRVDGTDAETLLSEAIGLSPTGSNEQQAAVSLLLSCDITGATEQDNQTSVDPASGSTDILHSTNAPMDQSEQSDDLAVLQQTISILEALARSSLSGGERDTAGASIPGSTSRGELEHIQGLDDLEETLLRQREAVSLSPGDHPDKPWLLHNLGNSLINRFERYGQLNDLEEAILKQCDAVRLTPDGHPHKPGHLNNLAISFRKRFERLGQLNDLEEAITRQRSALLLTPDENPEKLSRLNNLGNSLMTRFRRLKDLSNMEEAILVQREVVHRTPDGHPQKPGRLNNLAGCIRLRFEHLGLLNDLEEAISMQRDGVQLTPDGHPRKPIQLNSLGSLLIIRFHRLGELGDLEEAISMQRGAIHLTPDGHPDKPERLNNLGVSLMGRFKRLGELKDIEEAVSRQQDAVDHTPEGHPDKPSHLSNLCNSLMARFERLGELTDLEKAILGRRDAVHLTPDGHPDKLDRLSNLATSVEKRFVRLGELKDLEEAISLQRGVVHPTPDGHPRKPVYLDSLGSVLVTRFQRFGELSDLEEAISTQRSAVLNMPDGHPDKPSYLNNLGNSLRCRFERRGELNDLEEAISVQCNVVDLTPDGHLEKPSRVSYLGNSLIMRFERLGELRDLEKAISWQRDAIRLAPDGYPHKPGHLSNLANSLVTRFERFGGLSDLEEAISKQQDAVKLISDSRPHKASHLMILGSFFLTRFARLGGLKDLEDAISRQRDAVGLTLDSHPDKPSHLMNLSISLFYRFKRLGELRDLEEAILKQKDALRLAPDGHLGTSVRLSNLGIFLMTRFKRLEKLSDLEEAITKQRDAIRLTPDSHPQKPNRLNNLGNSLMTRFERLGELSDIQEAILVQRDAVRLTPDSHPEKPNNLMNLALSLFARFGHLGELKDMEEAISRQEGALQLLPENHLLRPTHLNNLGNLLGHRYKVLGRPGDLEEAISNLQDALQLIPNGHPDKPSRLQNLGLCFKDRFDCLEELNDLEEAILHQRTAVGLTPDSHPHKPVFLYHLGEAFLTRFERFGTQSDLEQSVSLYSRAACATAGSVVVRFYASRQWIFYSRLLGHRAPLYAYSVAIRLLPQLAWIGLPLAHRYRELAKAADVAREAAAAALDSGQPETAVEWLEQGRSIVWGEMSQLRSSYDELLSTHPDYARRLRELSTALEHASATREKSTFSPLEQTLSTEHRTPESIQEVADEHRALAIERDQLLEDIRKSPGYERFLLHKEFSQLRPAAHAGPVVILNVAETRCDALIVLADVEHVIHVPLQSFTLERSVNLQKSLRGFVCHARDGRPVPLESGGRMMPVLASLWKCVVKPVLDALALSIPGELSRIFWCPTGPLTFLPVHAAGFYDAGHSQPGHKAYDFVVSSYVPSLRILSPPSETNSLPNDSIRLLAVRQPSSDGQRQLPGVQAELEQIRAVIGNFPSARITLVESSVGTVEEVLELMKGSHWVHFACHGIQDTENPTASGLCLADGRRLKLSDVISLSRPPGGLAFLSACQTATGDENLSDEAIHVAAGMLYAGYGGVVGTMWSISDKLAPDVASGVYEQLFSNKAGPDCREAARALHVTVGQLRSKNVPFDDWLPFIHVGL